MQKSLAYCDAIFLGYKRSGIAENSYDICYKLLSVDKEYKLPFYGKYKHTKSDETWDKRFILNKVGSIQFAEDETGFYFELYYDQSLRRRPDLDIDIRDQDTPTNIPCIGWCNQSHPAGFLVPMGVIPHSSSYVPDEAQLLSIAIPEEFEKICNIHGTNSENVLNEFINNIGNFSCKPIPRADFRQCKDIRSHHLATAYLKAIYRERECL